MAVAAVGDQLLSFVEGIINVLGTVHGQHGGQLLVGEFFAQIHAGDLADQNLGILRHIHTSQLGDGCCFLTDDLGIQCTVDQNGLANLIQLVLLQKVTAPGSKFLLYLVVHLIQHNGGLLRGADHAVIEGLGMNDAVDSQQHIGAFVNDGGRIASTHTYGRLAGGISSLHHAGATCCQDNIGFLHGHVGQLQAGHVNPADDAFRRTGSNSGFQHNLGGSNGAALGTGMGADDDAVPGLQGKQGLEDGC